ncbi:SLC13 family permease [Ignavigranum ruoffiae]|uniref:Di-and tricarboxylate transporter n=1 Tax=Ignavigranum ruoffiae TaxID=89093 RepID=A0A1H9BNP1_9LACT|nr:SLC13 family permease [Ignavigranum ruoffiae]SEP90008.1 Di-and tricarboxylate transporter [Ignavigranum ruoffiae]
MNNIKVKPLAIVTLITLLLAWLNPLALTSSQNIVLAGLFFTVGVWATGAFHKTLACLFLLLVFILFGQTSPWTVVSFLWSDVILLIATTTLLSVGMMKAGIIDRFVESLFRRCSGNTLLLLLLPYVLGLIMIFLIPQAFARVIIIGTIFNQLLKDNDQASHKTKQFLVFNGFMAISMTYMFFNNGDIVLNGAALNFAGPEVQSVLTFERWFTLMSVPTLATCLLVLGLSYFLFRQEIQNFKPTMIVKPSQKSLEMSAQTKNILLLVMLVIIGCWMSESIHHLRPWIPASVGVILMFVLGVLKQEDLKSVNPHFLIFLITVFLIGKVLGQTGITGQLFEKLTTMIPETSSAFYLFLIIAVIMGLHICIGSAVATMSVTLPIMIPLLVNQGYQAEMITLMTYIIVNIHFLFPYHHATLMIGTAKGYYPDQYMLRFGLVMTVVIFAIFALLYFPWWHLMGIL